MVRSVAERFWEKVYKTENCWFWLAGQNEHGYGVFMLPPIKKAHRIAWLLTYGSWPAEHLLHHCDTPQCVRPDHLFEGSDMDNRIDRTGKGVDPNLARHLKEFCKRGHPRTPENLKLMSKGGLGCRPCLAILSHKYYLRYKAKRMRSLLP